MAKDSKTPVKKQFSKGKKPQPKQENLNITESGRITLNIYLRKFSKDDDKKGGPQSGVSDSKGASMDGDDEASDAVLNINIYL